MALLLLMKFVGPMLMMCVFTLKLCSQILFCFFQN